MAFDNNLSSAEDLDNMGNGNKVDYNVDESISDNEERRKFKKLVKKEVDELNGTTNIWMIL